MLRIALWLVALGSALGALSTEARGEPALTSPVAEGSTDVPYPEGASGDADVLLELVVEPDGAVSRVVVVEGKEPSPRRW